MKKTIKGIGELNFQYSMYYKEIELAFLGKKKIGLLKFNCIDTNNLITREQTDAFNFYKQNESLLDNALAKALVQYKKEHHIPDSQEAYVSSVEFSNKSSYFFLEITWDSEQGLIAIFDKEMNIDFVDPDIFL